MENLQKLINDIVLRDTDHLFNTDFLLTWEKSMADVEQVLDIAEALKSLRNHNISTDVFKSGLAISQFRDNSTRTRFSFSSAANLLGLGLQDLDEGKSQIAHGETTRETVNMISFLTDIIGIRDDMYLGAGNAYMREVGEALDDGFAQGVLPQRPGIVNLQCDIDHPTQSMADLAHLKQYFGSLAAPEKSREIKIVGPAETHSVPMSDVFTVVPIDHGFWRKLHGSVNFGFSYTQSNKAIQYSLSADSRYWTRKILGQVQLNSNFNTQEDADTASQQNLSFFLGRTIKKRSGWFGVGQLQSNPAQGFDLRTVIGGGYNRFLMKRSDGFFIVSAGLAYDRELVTESSRVDNSAEALVGLQLANYSDDHPKRTITLGIYTFSNITESPRFRAQLNFSLSWTVFHNFDVSINLIDNYDSRPPTPDALKNDASLNTSIGYTF